MSQPQVVFGAGHVHITQIRDALGNTLNPPQVIAAPAVQNITADFGKADTKMLHGQKEFAIHAAQGKKSTEVSFEVGELTAQILNVFYFGQSLAEGSHKIYRDSNGIVLPSASNTMNWTIQNNKVVSLGKHVVYASATIQNDGVHAAATRQTDEAVVLTAGNFFGVGGKYRFASADKGKEFKLTWKCLDKTTQGGTTDGTTVVSTFKIPASLAVNMNGFTTPGTITGLTKNNFSNTTPPVVDHYYFRDNGVLIFNSTQGAASIATKAITHTTDGVAMSSLIASLPATGYVVILNPASYAQYLADMGVKLKSGSAGSLTIGDALAQSASPATGQYDVDTGGVYTFAAADADAVVTLTFQADTVFTTIAPAEGAFVEDKGVRNVDGMSLTRVAITAPLALLKSQYAVDDGGTYYFDSANAAETLYVDYEHTLEAGVTLPMQNNDMGSTPMVSIDLSGIAEGQEWLIKYPRAIPKAFSFATKLDDFGTYKISYDIVADRVSNKVGTIYMTG